MLPQVILSISAQDAHLLPRVPPSSCPSSGVSNCPLLYWTLHCVPSFLLHVCCFSQFLFLYLFLMFTLTVKCEHILAALSTFSLLVNLLFSSKLFEFLYYFLCPIRNKYFIISDTHIIDIN